MGRRQLFCALVSILTLAGAAGGALASGSGNAGGSGPSNSCGCAPTTPPSHPQHGRKANDESNYTYGVSSSSASASVSTTASGAGAVNTQALVNEATGGGGGSWSEVGGVTTTIDSIKVETPLETRRVCAAFKAELKMIAVEAVCLDDKAVPHPASQVSPDRAVAQGFEGEIYRCIAGSRLQYTLAEDGGQVSFARGQTLTCQKGEALYHRAGGELTCRPQKPARDCNERSLLRRYGAGVKVLQVSRNDICVAWRTDAVQTDAAP